MLPKKKFVLLNSVLPHKLKRPVVRFYCHEILSCNIVRFYFTGKYKKVHAYIQTNKMYRSGKNKYFPDTKNICDITDIAMLLLKQLTMAH